MKKFLVFVAIVMAVTILPLSAYADNRGQSDNRHDNNRVENRHDRSDERRDRSDERRDSKWKERHDQKWNNNEREWKERDRQWREHRNDRRWREAKAREWGDWYQWHKDNETDEMRLRLSTDNFDLDIDLE